MQLDKGRLIVVIVAAVSIAVWLVVFPMVLVRGPAGAYSGEEGGVLCFAGGEAHADADIVRFVRRFHYLGVRAEVKTGGEGQLCFILSFARRIPEVADAVVRRGVFTGSRVDPDLKAYFSEEALRDAGFRRNDAALGPAWTATSAAPVRSLALEDGRPRTDLPGSLVPYCRRGICTPVIAANELITSDDVMAAFPIRSENGEPALLLRLTPPALQRLTEAAGGPEGPGVPVVFTVDGEVTSVAMTQPPKADGQIRIPLDPDQRDVEFEAAELAALLSTGPIEGNWERTELRLAPKSEKK